MKRREMGQAGDPAFLETFAATLRARPPFSDVDAARLAEFVRAGVLLELDTGEFLIREGEPAAAEVYLLVEGSLVVQGQAGFIARLDRPGDIVGEVAVLLSSRRTADVVAESAVRAVAIPSALLSRPEFAAVAQALRGAMMRDDWIQY